MNVQETIHRCRFSWLFATCLLPPSLLVAQSAVREGEQALELGVPIRARITEEDPLYPDKGHYKRFLFSAAREGPVTVALESRLFDAHLVVEDNAGEKVAEDADSGPGDGARLVFEPEAGRQYRILAIATPEECLGDCGLSVVPGKPEKRTPPEDLAGDLEWYEGTLREALPLDRKLIVLGNLGRTMFVGGQFRRAREIFEEGLEAARKSDRLSQEGLLLHRLGEAHNFLSEPREAVACLDKALEIYRKLKDREGEGTALGSLGTSYRILGRPDRAVEYYEQGLRIHRQSGDRLSEAKVSGNAGAAYLDLGRPDKALESYERAVALHREMKNRRSEGIVLGGLGNAHRSLARPERAVQCYEKALEIHREVKNRRSEGIVLSNVGNAYRDLGRSEEAVESYEKALEIHREVKNRRSEGILLGNLGGEYSTLGQPDKAVDCYERAIEIFRQTQNRHAEGIFLAALASIHSSFGRPELAVDCYERALVISRQTKNRRLEGGILGDLGLLYFGLGRPELAVDHYEDALEISREARDRRGEGTTLSNLGIALGRLGQTERMLECYEKALQIRRDTKDPRGEASTLAMLGVACARGAVGRPERAVEYLEEALEISRKTRSRRSEGIYLGKLGVAYRSVGRPDKAVEHLEKALKIHRETKDRQSEGIFLGSLGLAYSEQGRAQKALGAYRVGHRISMDILEAVERGLEESAVHFYVAAEGRDTAFQGYLRLLAELHGEAQSTEERNALLSEALEVLENLRSRTLSSAMRTSDLRGLLSPAGRESWDRRRWLRMRIAELRTKAFRDFSKDAANGKRDLEELAARVKPLEEEAAALERRLKATEARYSEVCAGTEKIRPDRFAEFIGKGETLVHYNVIGGRVAVILWDRKGGLALVTLDTSEEDLDRAADDALASLRPSPGARPRSVRQLKEKLGKLREMLLSGLEERLEGTEGLVIIPWGKLHLLPFEMLVLADGQYLVERYDVRYAPAIRVLSELAKRKRAKASLELVAYGDPEFGNEDSNSSGPALAVALRGERSYVRLAHSARELESVGDCFDNKIVRQGSRATEADFKREAGRATILHVATHGRFSTGTGQQGSVMFHSGLVFAGYHQGGDGEEDGFLTAGEVLGLDLRAVDLVVLSACETAAGSLRGHEGKFGLERALFISGVKTFVGSLWQVDDAATSRFMSSFYRNLRSGLPKAEALRRTKLSFISGGESGALARAAGDGDELRGAELRRKRAGRPASLSHPFYWAPFVLSGDGTGILRSKGTIR